MISENVDSIPQKMLQASKRAYDGKLFLVNRGPTHLRPFKGTTKESQRFVSHVFYRQRLVHFSIWHHLRDKTTPMALGSIRKHQHLAAGTGVVQGNGMHHKILRVRPGLEPALRPRGGRNSAIFSQTFRPPRSTRHQFFEKQTQGLRLQPFAATRYATSSWLGEIASVPQRSRDA